MKIQHPFSTVALLVVLLPLLSVADGETRPDFGFAAGAGYQYDSNVNVAELDTNTGEADSALLLNVGLNASLPLADSLSLRVNYDFSQTSYRDYATFDLGIHHAQAELAYGIAGFDTAVSLDRFGVRLDREPFLVINQVSPSVARLFGESVYVRAAFTRGDKTYADAGSRDAVNEAIRADTYLLFDGMNRYLSLGYQLDSEDALDGALDYDGNRAMIAYGHRVDFGLLKVDLKTRLQIENRNYVNVTEAIGEQRRDQRLRAGVAMAIPLGDHFKLNNEIDYADNRSNLVEADFDEIVYGVNLSLRF
jgi:hypothetical protein